MKKRLTLAAVAVFAIAGSLLADTISFKLSYVIPRMKSDFWNIEFDENMSFTRSNFQDTSFGVAYEYFLTRELSLVFGVDTYGKSKGGFYRDWVGYTLDDQDWAFPSDYEGEFSLSHSLYTSVTPLQVSLKVLPLGRRGRIIPYAGVGAGLYLWSLRMQGDMVDFNDEYVYEDPEFGDVPVYPVYIVDAWEGRGFGRIAFGWQAFGGVMIPVANRLTLDLEFKSTFAKGKFSTGAEANFEGFAPLDLGALHVSLGINYWF
jgi:opacity protein-like surface antigen